MAGDQFGSGVGANLTISLIDLNDNPPVFSQSSYNFTVSENSHNQILGRVTSTDVDTHPQTLYRIVGDAGPFIIDTDTGQRSLEVDSSHAVLLYGVRFYELYVYICHYCTKLYLFDLEVLSWQLPIITVNKCFYF